MKRAAWVPLHRWAGLAIAVFIVVTGLSGSIIAFREELDALINPDLYRVPARAEPMLGPSALAAGVEAALPAARAAFIFLGAQPGHSTRVLVQGGRDPATGKRVSLAYDEVFVDPYTGKVLGQRKRRGIGESPLRTQILPVIYEVHRTLLAGPIGKWFLGIIAFVWMLDSFVGFYLTLPVASGRKAAPLARTVAALPRPGVQAEPPAKTWWRRWKPAWQIKRGASFYRTQFDLHRAAGLWLWGCFSCWR
ncbi:PepSY-associated TM helix domain-containing protein [Pigmentiphaga litoralis]|uniref:PepSY-associated TM helix domain-containing protein n=1 Tax=Pigmentiphaga litoralis TaxID=516702 RepID=UPI003B43C725